MNVWMHKKTGELAIARKVWLECDMPINLNYSVQLDAAVSSWAFQNKHGIIMILPTKIQKEFEDLGEL